MVSAELGLGDVLRLHEDGGAVDVARRVIHIREDLDLAWWIDLPASRVAGASPKEIYVKAPRPTQLSALAEGLENGSISKCKFEVVGIALLDDEQLAGRAPLPPCIAHTRKKLAKWKAHRDRKFELIRPIVEQFTFDALLVSGMCGSAVAGRAAELGESSGAKIYAALHQYWLGGSVRNALLPRWVACGAPGVEKFSDTPTGRPNRTHCANTSDHPPLDNYLCNESDRMKLRRGWVKYKKPNVSVEVAYLETAREFWAESISYDEQGQLTVKLLAAHLRPSRAQFERHGPGKDPTKSASRINAGRQFDRKLRGLRGTTRDNIAGIGHLVIDATCSDQTLVSIASRGLRLRSPWDTRAIEPLTGYVFGSYVSFEPESTLTGLMALRSCVLPKGPQCEPYGIQIKEERDWYSISPKRVLADNGPLKSEAGIRTLSESEILFELTRSYAAEHKLVEGDHHRRHALTNHLQPGSTRGCQRGRGEPDHERDACKNFNEYMADHIDGILFSNNEEIVPELLTIEMRSDGLQADSITRRAALEWYLANGYFQSQPTNLDELLLRTLPKIRGKLLADGVHLFDPRNPHRYVPRLVFRSTWLEESRWLANARKKPIDIPVHIAPERLSAVWVILDNELRELPLRSTDPLLSTLTLFDWLTISDNDSLRGFLARGLEQGAKVTHLARMSQSTENAKKAKADEAKTTPRAAQSKNANTQSEIQLLALGHLGLDQKPVQVMAATPPSFAVWDLTAADDSSDQFMANVRAAIAEKQSHA